MSFLRRLVAPCRDQKVEAARAANERRIEELRTQSRRLREAIRRLQHEGGDDG